jgi:molecular chaperone GrpE
MNQRHSEDFDGREAAAAAGAESAEPATDQDRPEAAAGREPAAEPQPAAGEAELAAELAATKERLLRALAETENLRRRAAREVEEAHKYAITGFARELLEVADNLNRALASIPPHAREQSELARSLVDGVALTEKSLHAAFERHQIAKVVPELGEKFDHNRHQAMLELETADFAPGTVAQVMQPGYVIADRLLRPALVAVAKAPRAAPEPPPTNGESRVVPIKPGDWLDTTA